MQREYRYVRRYAEEREGEGGKERDNQRNSMKQQKQRGQRNATTGNMSGEISTIR